MDQGLTHDGRGAVGSRIDWPLAVALSAALFASSLMIDVGIARAAMVAGDPGIGAVGACIGACGAAFVTKGRVAKYGFGALCFDCIGDLWGQINKWSERNPSTCSTGVLGMPCPGRDIWRELEPD